MTIEDILCETGGFGRFQLFIVLGVGLTRFTIGWSMLQMTYVGMVPDWNCLDANSTQPQNGSLHICSGTNMGLSRGVKCDSYRFTGSSVTIINEWTLICDLRWVKPAIVSIQMSGVLLGSLLAGQLGDSIGRKRTLYAFVLQHAILNFITAFSVSWQMFAVCRFLIGVGIGGVLVCSFPYSLEFLPLKWRPLVSVLPFWSVGLCVFALASSIMQNWSHLHITCGVLSLPGVFVYFFLPESLRWLTVKDRMKDAHDLVMKMAVVNHKLQPRKASITLQAVAWEEQKGHESDKLYTYMDLFREWLTTQTTLIFCFHWFCLSLVYYGMSFGVTSMAASVPVNIFLLALVEIPAKLATFHFDKKIGRRWTSIIAVGASSFPVFACLIVTIHGQESSRAAAMTVLYLLARIGTGAAWAVAETWCSEIYPTVTRCLGLGALTAAASVGGIIMPFVVNLEDFSVASFSVMGCLLLADTVLCYFTPETKDLELADTPVLKVCKTLKVAPEDIFIKVDNNEQPNGNNTITDTEQSENTISHLSLKVSLEIVNEESSDIDTYENSSDTSEKQTPADNDEDENSLEDSDTESKKNKTHSNTKTKKYKSHKKGKKTIQSKFKKHFKNHSPRHSPKIEDKSHEMETELTESKCGNHLASPSPPPSPAPSPKIKDKIQRKEHEVIQSIKHLVHPSPRPSPVPSPKVKDKQRKEHEVIQSIKHLVNPSPRPSPVPSPKIKDKHRKEHEVVQSIKHLVNPSPRPSPVPSPKIKDKHRKEHEVVESKAESTFGKHLGTPSQRPSPNSSPASSPKIKDKHRKERDGLESKFGKNLVNPSPRPSPNSSPAPSPKIKDKARRRDHDIIESISGKNLVDPSPRPSPNSSPAPSPKRNRLEKLRNSDLLPGKSKSKHKDDSPPYIESSRNKNVRFSIY